LSAVSGKCPVFSQKVVYLQVSKTLMSSELHSTIKRLSISDYNAFAENFCDTQLICVVGLIF